MDCWRFRGDQGGLNCAGRGYLSLKEGGGGERRALMSLRFCGPPSILCAFLVKKLNAGIAISRSF